MKRQTNRSDEHFLSPVVIKVKADNKNCLRLQVTERCD